MVFISENILIYFATILVAIIISLFLYLKYIYMHWSLLGIEYIEPTLLFGNFKNIFFGEKKHFLLVLHSLYNQIRGPFGGIYNFISPNLLIKDPKLLKQVLIKDFDIFMNRGFIANEEKEPLTAHLLALEGERWRYLRNKLSPTFTSGKLKHMQPIIVKIGENLQIYLDKIARSSDNVIEMRDMVSRYTVDIITSVAFGVETDCINNVEEPFKKLADRLAAPSPKDLLRALLSFIAPKLGKRLGIRTIDKSIEDFIRKVTEQAIELRESKSVVRQDFMQLMVQLRNAGKVNDDDDWSTKVVDDKSKQLTVNEIMAQVFLFFLGGFDTSATVLSFTLFELAKNKSIQKKLQDEIDTVLKRHDGKLTYEAAMEMKYAEQVMDEGLRMYPSVPILLRQNGQDWKIPETDKIIKKGTSFIILVYGLHYDPKYYPNPEVFDPERFTPEAKMNREPFTYLPFGDGPRNCIGKRLGLLQFRIGLISILSKFNLELGPNQSPIIKIRKDSGFLADGGLNIAVSLRRS